MTLFCSAREFESLCCDISGKADVLRLQAKGGSMYPFIRSGDCVDVALCKGKTGSICKGDIVLFKKGESLYLHRVLQRRKGGFIAKGDMSFGSDGIIPFDDALACVIAIRRGSRYIDLHSRINWSISVLAAGSSLFLQYPFLFFRKMCSWGMSVLFLVQGIGLYRYIVKKLVNGKIVIRIAGPEDVEQLSDLYRMAGHDIREGLARIKNEGLWLVAVHNGKVAGGLTMSAYEKDAGIWVIFGLEVKPFLRGMGVGRAVVEAAVSKAKDLGVRQLGLFVKKNAAPALALYRSLGFKETCAVPTEFNRSCEELYLSYDILPSQNRHDRLVHFLSKGGFDRGHVLERAVEEGVFYPFYRELLRTKKTDAVVLPGDVDRFKQMYYLCISKSCDFISRVERILGCLESFKIKVLLFKGPAVDSFIYDDFMRPRLDIDIAAADEDMPALERALRDLGYMFSENKKDYPLPEYLNSRLFIHPSRELIPVHVHRNLINNMFFTVDSAFSVDMKKVWEEKTPFKNYLYICVLNRECHTLYLCEHALKHDFDQMVFLYEIERMIGCCEGMFDWRKFVALARDLCLSRQAYYGLYFVRELLSGSVPQEVVDALKPERFTPGEKSFIKNTLRLKRRRYSSYPVYCAMRTDPLKKIHFIFRTVFPPAFTFKGYMMRVRKLILP